MARTGVILVNVGTPDAPRPRELARYLREFLMDPFIIDLPYPLRWLLVHAVIVPRRARYSAEAYSKIWTERGSPLRYHSQDLAAEVSRSLGDGYLVTPGMCVGNPSIQSALAGLREQGAEEIVAVPLFLADSEPPYFATRLLLERARKKLGLERPTRIARPYSELDGFYRLTASRVAHALAEAQSEAGDHVLFSFHGVPERYRESARYRAQCLAAAARLAETAGLAPGRWTCGFQSRLGRTRWIGPYTEELLDELPRKGVRGLVVACPSFAADGLETIEEMGLRNRERFLAAGGERYTLVPALNSAPEWAECIASSVRELLGR